MTVVGTVGNTLVIGAVLIHRKLRVLSNVFIVNLAVTDLIVSTGINSFYIMGKAWIPKYPAMYPEPATSKPLKMSVISVFAAHQTAHTNIISPISSLHTPVCKLFQTRIEILRL